MKVLGLIVDALAPILMIVGAILIAIGAGLSLAGVIGAAFVGSGFAFILDRIRDIAEHLARNTKG